MRIRIAIWDRWIEIEDYEVTFVLENAIRLRRDSKQVGPITQTEAAAEHHAADADLGQLDGRPHLQCDVGNSLLAIPDGHSRWLHSNSLRTPKSMCDIQSPAISGANHQDAFRLQFRKLLYNRIAGRVAQRRSMHVT